MEVERAFGEMVHRHRRRFKWTLEELSEMSGIPAVKISRIERSERRPYLIEALRLVKALGIQQEFNRMMEP